MRLRLARSVRASLAAAPFLLGSTSGCGRELALPDPPAPPAVDAAPRPQYLGELSGIYGLSVRMPFTVRDNGPVTAPLPGALALLQLPNPTGDGPDPLFLVNAGTDGPSDELLFGFAEDGMVSLTSAGAEQAVQGRVIPGGGAIALQANTQICDGPGGQGHELLANRTCLFEPALSGIYEGPRADGTCSPEGGDGTLLALGFRDPYVIGVEWPAGGVAAYPQGSTFFFGGWERFDARGVLFSVKPSGAGEVGYFELAESGGSLQANLQLKDARCDRNADCDGGATCEAGVCSDFFDLPCSRSYALSRLSGREPDECASRGESLLVIDAQPVVTAQGRFVDLRVVDMLGGSIVPSELVEARIVPQPGSEPREPVEITQEGAHRFALDRDARAYELWAYRKAATIGQATAAYPSCFRDAR